MRNKNCNTNRQSRTESASANPFIDILMDVFGNGMSMMQDFNGGQIMASTPKMNAYTTEDNVIVGEFLMPGVASKDDIKISYNDKYLTISYEAPTPVETTEENQQGQSNNYIVREFNTNRSYKRNIRIRQNMDLDNMSAKYENAILTVHIPTKEPVQPEMKQVNVN